VVADWIFAEAPMTMMPWLPFPDAVDDWILLESPMMRTPSPFPEAVNDWTLAEAPCTKMPLLRFPEAIRLETLMPSANTARTPS
jgi:hypothetical protein